MYAIVKFTVRMTSLALILSSTTACDRWISVPTLAAETTPTSASCTTVIDDLDPACTKDPPG